MGVVVLDGSLTQWAVGTVAPGVAAGVAAHLWVRAPLRARGRGKEGRLFLAGTALLLLASVLCLVGPSAGSWAWLPRVAATAWLTVAAGAVPRLLGSRQPRVVPLAASPYRTPRAIDGPSRRAFAEERATFRLALALTLLAGVGGLASAPPSHGWRPWHDPAASE
jgi:hypothetical protein